MKHTVRRAAGLIVAIWGGAATTLAQSPGPRVSSIIKLTNIETSYPYWSPDGTRIVYQSNRTGNSEIYVMNADGTGAVRLTDHPAADENPSWSPDGRHIAFRSSRDGNGEIYVMAPDGTGLRNLTNHPADDTHPYWSADSATIVFNSARGAGDAAPRLRIFAMDRTGGNVTQITRGDIEETYAQPSPDGRSIVFRRRLDEPPPAWSRNPGNSEIFIADADAGNARRLTTHDGFDGWPSWSPDGGYVTYASEDAGPFQIYLVRRDGSDPVRLTNGPGSFTKPIFSPDGSKIICTRTLEGNVEIFVIQLDRTAEAAGVRPIDRIARAAEAMGGAVTLAGLPNLVTDYYLSERSLGQEEVNGGPAAASVQLGRREYHAREQRERLTMRRHMSGGRLYERTLDGGRWGRLEGADGSDHTSSGLERALSAAIAALHPESLLPALLGAASSPTIAGGTEMMAGRRLSRVTARLAAQPIDLFFDDTDGLLRAVEWIDPQLGGRPGGRVRMTFGEYRRASRVPGTPRLPHLVEVWRGPDLWQSRSYAEFSIDTPQTTFDDPPARPGVRIEVVEVTPGVHHVRGGDYHSLLVDAGERVVVMDAPESNERAAAVLREASRVAAGRPITVVVTHAHDDHIGGLAAAAGLDIVAHESVIDQLAPLLPSQPETSIRPIVDELRFGTGSAAFHLLSIRHSHAAAMIVGWHPASGLLYETDLMRGLLPQSTLELVDWVAAKGLPVKTVASSHGPVQQWDTAIAKAIAWRDAPDRRAAPAQPPARAHHSMVYDAANRVVVVAGGSTTLDGGNTFMTFDDLWFLDGQGWRSTGSSGSARSGMALAFDSRRGRVVGFGGYNPSLTATAGASAELIELRSGAWVSIGEIPSRASTDARMIYDARRDRLVLFGGQIGRQRRTDLWEYDGAAWSKVDVPVPADWVDFAMTYDEARGRTVLFGGFGSSPDSMSGRPPALHWENLALDTARERLVLFGGATRDGGYLQGTWEWDGARWRVVADAGAGPGDRHAHAMGFDPGRRQVVLFGGVRVNRAPDVPAQERESPLCDTWGFDGRQWTLIDDGPCVTDRSGATSIVYDERRARLLLVDGPPQPGDSASRPLRLWQLAEERWAIVDAAGPRGAERVAYDSARGVLVVPVLEGPDVGVWEWNGQTWRHAKVRGPGMREQYGIAYDPGTRRVTLIGGLEENPRRFLADRWAWDGAAWAEVPADGRPAPGPRSHTTLLTDARNARLLYYGGASQDGLLQELWFLGSDGWTQWSPGGPGHQSTQRRDDGVGVGWQAMAGPGGRS